MHTSSDKYIGEMTLFFLLTLFSLSNAFILPSPQCISHLANDIMTKEEKYHWKGVYEELIKMENVKEDLFALLGYHFMEIVEERCANDITEGTITKQKCQKSELVEDIRLDEKMENDCLVLSDLYDSAGGGISWGFNSCWKNNCCDCDEVTCNEGRVKEVNIRGLTGSLPNNLWDMSEMESLILVGEGQGNESYPDGSVEDLFNYIKAKYAISTNLIGGIPSGEGVEMNKLRTLVMYGSFDVGCIPSFRVMEMINTLMIVGEFDCDLSSVQLPPEVERLQLIGSFVGNAPTIPRSATFVDIEGQFDGTLNKEYFHCLNSSMNVLILGGNFEGIIPSSISDLKQLTWLGFVGNFVGIIPSTISDLKQLTGLDLIGSFEGTIPSSISNLKQLTWLQLIGNFEGIIPSSISDLKQLTWLQLIGNFEGIIPSSIFDLKQLTLLGFIGNFKGAIPSSISDLKQLTRLGLVGNFEGTIPSSISDLKQLTWLQLVGNFEETVPSSIFHLYQLTSLVLVGNFTGALQFRSDLLKSLNSIRIVGNFDGELTCDSFSIPSIQFISICCRLAISRTISLQNMTNLRNLDLAGNDVGHVGSYISNLKNLEVLILDGCNISSYPSFSSLPKLRYVSASHNNISDVGDLFFIQTMEQIDLSYNKIEGRFTAFSRSEYYKWPSLMSVSLSHNDLTEFVLMEAGSVPLLRDLDLSYNHLTGNLSSLMPLVFPSLKSLNFYNNSLSGHIPSTFSRFTHMETCDLKKNKDLRFSKNEKFSDRETQFSNDKNVTWTCRGMKIKTDVGYYDIEVDDTFQEYTKCTCDMGFYGIPPYCKNCEEVSPLAACPGGGGVYAPQGYWATPPMNRNERIYPKHVLPCGGAGTSATKCRPESTDYEKTCTSGYSGRMCSGCDSGYFSIGNVCMRCMKGSEGMIIMILALLMLFMVLILMSFSRKIAGSGSVKIMVVVIQTLYYVWNNRSISGGGYISTIFGYIGNLQIPGLSCYMNNWTYGMTYGVTLIFPVTVVMTVCVIYVVRAIVLRTRRDKASEWRNRSGTAIVFVIYLSYVGFSAEVIRPIQCEEDPGIKEKYMTNAPSERCNETLHITSVVLLLGVVMMIPFGLLYLYIKKGRPLKNSPLYTLSLQYHKMTWMWELVITARRMLIIVAFMVIPSQSVYQSLMVFIVLGGSLILQVRYNPFRSRLQNAFESSSLLLVIINYGVVLQYGSPETTQDSSLAYILVSVDLLFVMGCIILISRGFVHGVLLAIKRRLRKKVVDDDLKVSLVRL